jgi:hypothetical protein
MLYNDNKFYNQSGFVYSGSLLILVSSLSSPIFIGDIIIKINQSEDYSNNTSIGLVSYSLASTGIMSFQTTDLQAEAITTSKIITLNSVSGEVTIQS